MGKILLVNTGPTESVNGGQGSSAGNAEMPVKWAEAAAGKLTGYRISALYVCPVPGAVETARIISGFLNLEAQPVPGLSGLDDARWNMQGIGTYTAGNYADKATHMEAGTDSPFGDKFEKVRISTGASLDMLTEKYKKEAIAIISHPALSIVMVLHMLHMHNKHYWQIAQDAGAVSLFEVRFGVPSALYINDTCHLHGLI